MDKLEKFWDKQAKGYSKPDQDTPITNNKDFITTVKYLHKDDIVLDYGCATGRVSNAIADKVKEINGIDISSEMIDIARMKAKERGIKNAYYEHATIFDERYQKESFNIILAFRILHVLENPEKVAHRINEMLRPGGIFISVTACMGDSIAPLGMLISLAAKLRILPLHINRFKLTELQGLITKEGFQILEYEKMDDNIPHYCIAARKL